MIAFLFNFILAILFIAFIVVCVVAYRIYRSFHNIKKKFSSGFGETKSSFGRQQTDNMSYSDEVIIDRRRPDEVNRKIFSKNAGEYVEFEEEK